MTSLDEPTRSQIIAQVLEALEKRSEFLASMKQRQQKGWEVARQYTQILKEQLGVQRVVLFGSLLTPEYMSWHSDLELAVWGLPEKDYFRAWAAIERGHEFAVDLVEAQKAKPHILKAIKKGIEL